MIDLEQCSYEYFTETKQFPPIPFNNTRLNGGLNDIAVNPDGRLFGVNTQQTQVNEAAIVLIYELDIKGKIVVDTLLNELNFPISTSLGTKGYDTLFFGYTQLFQYSIKNRQYQFLQLTGGGIDYARYIIGDIVSFKGKLFASTYNVTKERLGLLKETVEILELDLNNDQGIIKFAYPSLPFLFGGMTVVCGNNPDEYDFIGQYRDNENRDVMVNINMESGEMNDVCTLALPWKDNTLRIYGLTSGDEFRTNCRLHIDLDEDDSGGRLIDHYLSDSLCTTTFPVSDRDVQIKSPDGVPDSIVIQLVSGAIHEGRELLTAQPHGGIEVQGMGTTRLTLRNNGTAELADFEESIRSASLSLPATGATAGERVLHTTLYLGGIPSDPAKTFIPFEPGRKYSAGEDAVFNVGPTRLGVNLLEELKGRPHPGGYWEPALPSGESYWIQGRDAFGIYRYIVPTGSCAADTAELTMVKSPAPAPLPAQTFICRGDTLTFDVRSPLLTARYQWNDRDTSPVKQITSGGTYFVEISDQYGCNHSLFAEVKLRPGTSTRSTQTLALCAGETLVLDGNEYSRDTTLCQTFALSSGCDSTACLELQFRPRQVRDTLLEICAGQATSIEGVKVSQDTIFCVNYTAVNGCDSLICVRVHLMPPPVETQTVDICAGSTFEWNGRRLSQTGIYIDTLQQLNGCDSVISLQLSVSPQYLLQWDTTILQGDTLSVGNVQITKTGTYRFGWETAAGCDSILVVHLQVDSVSAIHSILYNRHSFYHPGMLSGGRLFNIYHQGGLQLPVRSLDIFDLFGRRIATLHNGYTGDTNWGWDGSMNGLIAPAGLYIFHASIRLPESKNMLLSGKVLLMQ